jgi:hypothetical protein
MALQLVSHWCIYFPFSVFSLLKIVLFFCPLSTYIRVSFSLNTCFLLGEDEFAVGTHCNVWLDLVYFRAIKAEK